MRQPQYKADAPAPRKTPAQPATLPVNLLQAGGLLRLAQVLQLVPVSRSTWWAGVRSGRYPQPVKLGERATAWKADDIRALIENAGQAVQR